MLWLRTVAVTLRLLFGSLAVLSLLLLLWQWLVALRFPLHRRNVLALARSDAPSLGITLFKPLKGCDAATEQCLRSWFTQQYSGPIQILFGVASPDDPVCEIVQKLIKDFPAVDAQLIICGPLVGANAKVAKLVQLEPLAKHDLFLISDADVRIPRDLLSNLATRFSERGCLSRSSRLTLEKSNASKKADAAAAETAALRPVPDTDTQTAALALRPSTLDAQPSPGLINCFYSLANPATLAMHWEAIAINADFWTQVLQAQSIKPLDFALGAAMLTTRLDLQRIGGFAALANCLADDYQLGHRIARAGKRIELSTLPVECWSAPMTWSQVWKHQLRWARTIRVSQPVPYFFSILSNPTFWPLLWLAVTPCLASIVFAATAFCIRIIMALDSQTRLTQKKTHLLYWWLVPIKDLLQVALWAAAFLGNTIEWRGERMKLLPNGELRPVVRQK